MQISQSEACLDVSERGQFLGCSQSQQGYKMTLLVSYWYGEMESVEVKKKKKLRALKNAEGLSN